MTKDMLKHLKEKQIKEIVRCDNGKVINKNQNDDNLLAEINNIMKNNSKVDFYFENGSEIGFALTNESIRIYAKNKRIASANSDSKFKNIVDRLHQNNFDVIEYREKFRNQEYIQYIIKFLKQIFNNKKFYVKNNGTLLICYKNNDIKIKKEILFNSVENIVHYIKNGKIKEIIEN